VYIRFTFLADYDHVKSGNYEQFEMHDLLNDKIQRLGNAFNIDLELTTNRRVDDNYIGNVSILCLILRPAIRK